MATFAGASMVGRTASYLSTGIPHSLGQILVNRGDVITWTSGTGANQANKFFENSISLAASVATSYDFSAALVDPFGTAFVLTKLKYLYVYNPATVALDFLTLAGNIFASWGTNGDFENVGPGGSFLRCSPVDGYTVTNSTQDTLSITNNGANTITAFVTAWGI